MNQLIVGGGEIGTAYSQILGAPVLDIVPERCRGKVPKKVDILHICLRYSKYFERIVWEAIKKYKPKALNVMSTVPPGTTEVFDTLTLAAHSTTRGLHPNLVAGILQTPKHIGGKGAEEVAKVFRGVLNHEPILHPHARTTELAHIASNFQYFANIAWADEVDRWCRHYSVDFYDIMRYAETHNLGYQAMGMPSKVRSIVYPSGGTISGHCVKLAAELIPKELHGPLTRRLSEYN